jgi:hypothetical protein
MGWRGHRERHVMMAQGGICDKNYFDIVCGDHLSYTIATQGGVNMFNSLARSQRARGLLGATRFVVVGNFLRTGIVAEAQAGFSE